MSAPFPQTIAKFTDNAGRIQQPWIQYLQQFTQSPPRFIAVTVGASPFTYTALELGQIVIVGGTVTALHLVRGTSDLDITGQSVILLSPQDQLIVTYSVLPTITFIPVFGSSPR